MRMTALISAWWIWLAIALVVAWFVGAHNRLMRLRAAVLRAFATLDAALVRQIDYVQAASRGEIDPAAVVNPSTADTLRAAANASAGQMAALLIVARRRPLDCHTIAALTTALRVMLDAWERLHPGSAVLFESDGTLSRPAPLLCPGDPIAEERIPRADPLNGGDGDDSDDRPTPWPEPSAAAEIARRQFNLAVLRYNRAVRQVPAVLVAWLLRLKPAAALT